MDLQIDGINDNTQYEIRRFPMLGEYQRELELVESWEEDGFKKHKVLNSKFNNYVWCKKKRKSRISNGL